MTQAPPTDALTVDAISGWYNTLKSTGHCYIAYSGGLDSHVLLHLVATLLPSKKLSALHINHQLSPHANAWAEHCKQVCTDLNISCHVETVVVETAGEGLEAAARGARYRCFQSHLKTGDVLLQAHHADDQVETVLYRLLRGSGVRGLAGIPQMRPLGQGQLIRPLLPFSRSQIESYARQHKLRWIEDESNRDDRFDRNFLRNQLIPLISERWSDYRRRVTHSATMAAKSAQLDVSIAREDLSHLAFRQERTGCSIAIPGLLQLPPFRQANLIRFWIDSQNLPVPGHKILDTLFAEFLSAKKDAMPLLAWPGGEFRRFQERLYLMPPLKQMETTSNNFQLETGKSISLPGGGQLKSIPVDNQGLRIEHGMVVQVGFRQGGERCQPVGRGQSNTLKKLFQEYRLEPWLRDRTPLIYVNGELAAVGDLWVCEGFQAGKKQRGLKFEVTY